MRGLRALVVAMGVLIVLGCAVVGVTIVRRMTAAPIGAASFSPVVLDQPVGTRIAGIAPAGDRVALWLTGGGPDRVLLIDPRDSLAVVGTLSLSH